MHNGAYSDTDGRDRFHLLALAPNSARIMVRFWQTGTVAEFSQNLTCWFEDLDLVGRERFGYPPLKKLLRSTALLFKDDNIPPNLPADVIRSILLSTPLPETFVHAAIRRIKAEQGNVSYHRACIIKAHLNRKYRLFNQSNKNEQKELINMSLNTDDERVGYCLGRLFAVLEKLQLEAQQGIKATIRDRYYSSASCTPRTVFGTLMRMSTHHLKKLDNPEQKINIEKMIAQVMEKLSEFPSQLNMEGQGLFAIGYYHQKQAPFPKKTETDKGE